MYKQIFNNDTNEVTGILRLLDNAYIPFDQANIDYQEYLKWVDEGNTPEPVDEPEGE